MTAAERLLWSRVQRRAATLSPELARALFPAFAAMRDALSENELTRIIQLGFADRIFDQVLTDAVRTAAYQPVRERLRAGVVRGVKYYGRDIAIPASARTLTIAFDLLNPKTIEAIRALETRVITTLDASIRDTVKAFVENGLRDGVNPRTVARELRGIIGIAPNQAEWVRNYAQAVAEAHLRKDALGYALRDKRFDATVVKARLSGEPIPAEKAAKMVDAMQKRTLAFNAETNARTAALDAQKLAQKLSWDDAIAKGIVDGDQLRKTWVGVMDTREREEHVAMEGETVGYDETYSNGEDTPGESTFNCRCISRFFVGRAE